MFSSEYHFSENSCPNIPSTNIFISGADYDPNKNFDEEKHSVLSHHLGSDQNSGESLDISSSKHTPVEIISPFNNFDTRSNYTTLNASIYDELTPVFNFPEILEYKGNMLISYINASTSNQNISMVNHFHTAYSHILLLCSRISKIRGEFVQW
jgi:hypothetical protein